MGHHIRIFIGEAAAFNLYRATFPGLALFRLTEATPLLVLPLDDDFHDELHKSYGTGDWNEHGGPRLSTSDMTFAARASAEAPLAYVETDYFGGNGLQHAIMWRSGALAIGPATLDVQLSQNRPTSLWPINVVLRALGVAATLHEDEFTRAGLGRYRFLDDIAERGIRVD